ncbi:unnamed protein product [Dibothriocephalus latus]|uniref:Uncharacterized protein n=1 Tax=Dibothriocephalus latus TaxID=60516 RepID=A0A3P7NY98_DIBLA|nr:unnamed protein product [Dibothriocephalus latus]
MGRARRNYLHLTGHGVGAQLCVQEGPIDLTGRWSQVLARAGIQEPGIRKNMEREAKLIGLKLFAAILLPLLYKGTILAVFHCNGKSPVLMEKR